MASNSEQSQIIGPQVFGHPAGLFTLFFAEMWERFSYYGMRALLVFYMVKGFLHYNDDQSYAIYGAYTALVYATPFIGGILADRLLGARRAVIIGGTLMALGHLLMGVQTHVAFFGALGLLIVGNGFFKPNISTIVGSLYPAGSPRKDAGFTIFYMGINLGAAMSPLLCGYVGETYGWHYGFNLATIGMLIGLAVFAAPTLVTQIMIMGGALASGLGLLYFQNSPITLAINAFIAVSLVVAAIIANVALARGGLPAGAGAAPNPQRLKQPSFLGISTEWTVILAILLAIPVCSLLTQHSAIAGNLLYLMSGVFLWLLVSALGTRWATIGIGFLYAAFVAWTIADSLPISSSLLATAAGFGITSPLRVEQLLAVILFAALGGGLVVGHQRFNLIGRLQGEYTKVERSRLLVIVVLIVFSTLFWAFFEQAGSSINNFTDRNVNRVSSERTITAAEVGQTLQLPLNQAQLGYHNGAKLFTMTDLDDAREQARKEREQAQKDDPSKKIAMDAPPQVPWTVTADDVGMAVGGNEIPASTFQAANPIFIILLGLVFSAVWTFLGARNLEPSTPIKFALGILQLGLGFVVLWLAADHADSRGMVWSGWLVLAYLLHTTGELCLSPVGLSMITKMAPVRMVSTVMGAWFLSNAFANFLASLIAKLTGVQGEGDTANLIPAPVETIHVYGGVFRVIALTAIAASVICFALAPLIKSWMHSDEPTTGLDEPDILHQE